MCCSNDLNENNLNRRNFLKLSGLGAAGLNISSAGAIGVLAATAATPSISGNILLGSAKPGAGMRIGAPLKVQPALIYKLNERREATSWRRWGGLQTEEDVKREVAIIKGELEKLSAGADFPVEFLPVAPISTPEQGAAAKSIECDVQLTYWASGEYDNTRYDAFIDPSRPNIMFVRDESGSHYGGYLHAQSHFLRNRTDDLMQEGMDVWDVVVDDYNELLWRLRSLYGLYAMKGSAILAIGGASGWSPTARRFAPDRARECFELDIKEITYDELGEVLKKEMKNSKTLDEAKSQTEQLLANKGVTLHTNKEFLINAFVLKKVFRQLMEQYNSPAMTINSCMSTIMPLSKTTACMPLTLLNDEGLLAYCESDFAVVPACLLLRYISGKPVFFANPCIPNNGVTTMAHCMAPMKMDGINVEPTRIMTHYESDYGAAPKVEMRVGQEVTVIAPNFQMTKWTGFRGKVLKNPDHPICRTQVKVAIDGDWRELREKMQGFHWAICYGDHLRELGYALKRVGIEWQDLSSGKSYS
jgi:hypothetical protein